MFASSIWSINYIQAEKRKSIICYCIFWLFCLVVFSISGSIHSGHCFHYLGLHDKDRLQAIVYAISTINQLCYSIYHKVANSNMSCLEAHEGFFRMLMKGIFDLYAHTVAFCQKVDFLISKASSFKIYNIHWRILHHSSPLCLYTSINL